MQRITLAGSISLLSLSLALALAAPAQAQERGQVGQPPQPPPGGAMPPPVGGGAGGGVIPPGVVPPGAAGGAVIPPGVVPPGAGVRPLGPGGTIIGGNVEIGQIPVTPPPPIGYYAPVRAADYNMGKFFYYPYYYFPHSYWPTQTCQWPERPGEPYMRPPAYMAYPPFHEPHWRYEWYCPQKYYRGFHFWLDQF